MWIYVWNKQLKEVHIGSTPVKEIYLWDTKVRPEGPWYNLDLNNGQPIWRLHDGELWFRVNVKDASEPFKIAVNGYADTTYDWDISIDGTEPVRYYGAVSDNSINLVITAGKHYVKISPHNWITAGWARCMGNNGNGNSWNSDINKLEFGLERLPGFAFMDLNGSIGDGFLRDFWNNCHTLVAMPNEFSLPADAKTAGEEFLSYTWASCINLKTIPNGFNIPTTITSVGDNFLLRTWSWCSNLEKMPDGFTLPIHISDIGTAFCEATWLDCVGLQKMPEGFQLPQGLTRTQGAFLYETWRNCTSLQSMPEGFTTPQSLTEVDVNFLGWTWNNCASLRKMPDSFNTPQNLTRARGGFMHECWTGCSLLESLPANFRFPSTLTETGWGFFEEACIDCSSLTSNSPATPLVFPTTTETGFWEDCFWGSCPITPDTPTPWSSVMVHRS